MTTPEPTPESISPSVPPSPEAGPARRRAVTLLQAALAAAALWLTWRLVAGIRWGDLAARLATASWPLIALAVAFLLARYSVWDWRFRLAARRVVGRTPSPVLGFFVLLASAALNLITPSARLIGGLMRARYFARWTERSFGLLYGVVIYDQATHHVVMTLCTWIVLIPTALVLGYERFALLAASVLLAVALGIWLWTRRRGRSGENPLLALLARRAERQEGRLGRFYAHGHEAAGTFVRLAALPRLRWQALGTGVLFFTVNSFAQWLLFLAIGERVALLLVVAVVALGAAAGMLTGTPGGLGTTEAAMVAGFVAVGVDRVDAGAGTLLFRGLHYAVVLAVGLPALAVLEITAARSGARGDGADDAQPPPTLPVERSPT